MSSGFSLDSSFFAFLAGAFFAFGFSAASFLSSSLCLFGGSFFSFRLFLRGLPGFFRLWRWLICFGLFLYLFSRSFLSFRLLPFAGSFGDSLASDSGFQLWFFLYLFCRSFHGFGFFLGRLFLYFFSGSLLRFSFLFCRGLGYRSGVFLFRYTSSFGSRL